MNTSLLRASGTAAVFPSLLRNAAGGKAEPAVPPSRRPPTMIARGQKIHPLNQLEQFARGALLSDGGTAIAGRRDGHRSGGGQRANGLPAVCSVFVF
ncbi:hypothetical protein [Mesorhizobium escarrei]|uniref:hypothetical protein n=1 Tax=Mesorhizobium escarrei TaxID=666018 RepID=UPI0020A7A505|nr:hypothetical protein [Mesorhizobium escarrei]